MRKVIIFVVVIQILIIGILLGTSKIEDMTIATSQVDQMEDGWTMCYPDGTVDPISKWPYYGHAKAEEIVEAKWIISEDACGETISFLSADRMVEIWIEDICIYEFGVKDIRTFGKTPGSIQVFADIPADSAGKQLVLRMWSPYNGFASYLVNVKYGDRDVLILHFLKDKMFIFIGCIGILVCGIVIIAFAMIQSFTKKPSMKYYGAGLYLICIFGYNIVETKMLMLFYGNQYLYSNVVFVSLMLSPLFLAIYVYSIANRHHRGLRIFMKCIFANFILQILIQFTNLYDFMDMAFVSHCLFASVVALFLVWEIYDMYSQKKFRITLIGGISMAIGGSLDLIRCYTIKIGDLGKYTRIGSFIFGLCAIISFMREMIHQQVEMAENAKLEAVSSEIIQTLVTAIDAKDVYTKGHSTRVADYSVLLAKELGWDTEKVNQVRYKALLHDVGKIGIPDRVLNKADRLSDEEFDIIKSHTTIGADILSRVSSLTNMGSAAKYHHERYDGNGYPDGIAGEEIPEEARLICIADSYDAMSSDRAYRKALPKHVIRSELEKGMGKQFDPEMETVFLQLFEEGKLDEISGEYEERDGSRDINFVIQNLLIQSRSSGVTKVDFESLVTICHYIEGLRDRYGVQYHMVLISLECNDEISQNDLKLGMNAMEYSIGQSLRKVDVMVRASEKQFLLILTEVSSEKELKMVIERVFTGFYKNCLNVNIKPIYEVK